MKLGNMGLALAGVTLLASGCKLVDKIKDAADGENDSYCEAVCDWAVDCADGSSDLTADEMMSRCIEQTEEFFVDGCGGAEDGIPIEDAALLNECTADQREQDCDALIGNEAQIMGGHPPALTCIAGYGASRSLQHEPEPTITAQVLQELDGVVELHLYKEANPSPASAAMPPP